MPVITKTLCRLKSHLEEMREYKGLFLRIFYKTSLRLVRQDYLSSLLGSKEIGEIVIRFLQFRCMKILQKKLFQTITPASPGRSLRELSEKKVLDGSSLVRRKLGEIVMCLSHLSCMTILQKKLFQTSTPASRAFRKESHRWIVFGSKEIGRNCHVFVPPQLYETLSEKAP